MVSIKVARQLTPVHKEKGSREKKCFLCNPLTGRALWQCNEILVKNNTLEDKTEFICVAPVDVSHIIPYPLCFVAKQRGRVQKQSVHTLK
jgi:hypothetical protein